MQTTCSVCDVRQAIGYRDSVRAVGGRHVSNQGWQSGVRNVNDVGRVMNLNYTDKDDLMKAVEKG